MKIENKFELGQKVKIVPFNNTEGRIEGFYYSYNGLQYYVSFFVDYDKRENYFLEEELKVTK